MAKVRGKMFYIAFVASLGGLLFGFDTAVISGAEQAIQKICTCSANYTNEGMVRAKYEYHHGELNIIIEDTGKGVRKEVLSHVFDRFVKDDQNKITGTGLDMPIVKELVEQMGGQIELLSEQGKGTTCYLMIPCEMISREKKTEITN